ncbi:hypothetical protein THIX_30036 [Thiomonas sp. X19]|nr:hypothetical protein THIX_30036 [Thiomonas sp. X19]
MTVQRVTLAAHHRLPQIFLLLAGLWQHPVLLLRAARPASCTAIGVGLLERISQELHTHANLRGFYRPLFGMLCA